MFERRLKVVLSLPIVCGVIIVARLFQLQILEGEVYQQRADAALVSPKQFLPPLRGRILDRFGRVLVSDEPAHDVTVHYGVLSMNRSYLLRMADRVRKQEPPWREAADASIEAEVRRRLAEMWLTLERHSGEPIRTFRRRRDAICRAVERVRHYTWKANRARGLDVPLSEWRLREENAFHPILRDVSPEVRTRLELELSRLPCVRIEPSVRRVWREDTTPLCHLLGRLGEVSAELIRSDPSRDDWLACYRAGDAAGITGVERLAEDLLRGKRGFEERFRDGSLIAHVPPVDGRDVHLTIDLDLQQRVADLLTSAVDAHPPSTGASCVVLDVTTREILALVSVPTYDRDALRDDYAALRDDARRRPLLFRAVSEEYQPGSIIKPFALLAGFAHGLVDPGHAVTCEGQLLPGVNKWHCWTHWRGMPGHGPVAAEEAIQHSCNVYFYTLGQRINAERLTAFYRKFILGPGEGVDRTGGTGLIEERDGIIPTAAWMRTRRKRSFRPADGRNYAIGQGEIQLTPLQAANAFATLATGVYRDPTLLSEAARDRPALPIDGPSAAAWQLTRRGLYRCVNERGGTAYQYARLEGLEICGKTGSAQCVPRATRRRFTFPSRDGAAGRSVVASTVEAACEELGLPQGTRPEDVEVMERFPPPDPESGKVPTHAWFAGFAPYRDPKIALAVVVEHGGSGGRTAAPVGRQVFEVLLEGPDPYLTRR